MLVREQVLNPRLEAWRLLSPEARSLFLDLQNWLVYLAHMGDAAADHVALGARRFNPADATAGGRRTIARLPFSQQLPIVRKTPDMEGGDDFQTALVLVTVASEGVTGGGQEHHDATGCSQDDFRGQSRLVRLRNLEELGVLKSFHGLSLVVMLKKSFSCSSKFRGRLHVQLRGV